MKQITIRGISDNLHKTITAESDRQGMSVNRYLLHVLREAVGSGSGQLDQESEIGDLDHSAGTWTPEEFEQFMLHLDSQRSLDGTLW